MKLRNTIINFVHELHNLLRRGEHAIRRAPYVDGSPRARVLVRHDVETRRRAALDLIYGLAGAPDDDADLLDGDPERELEAGDGHFVAAAPSAAARDSVSRSVRRRAAAFGPVAVG